MIEEKLVHICEVCGKTEILTPDEAFEHGWDYPPRMGSFGIISPRTCGNCPIDKTAWWDLACKNKEPKNLAPHQLETVARILREPDSIRIK